MTTPTPTIVTLPSYPGASNVTYQMVSYAADLTGPLGGPTQRVLRLGSRFGLQLEYPPMPYDVARQWLSRLNYAEAYPLAVQFPQRGLNPVAPGALVVNGAAAAPINTGGQLGVRGGTPDFQLYDGQVFHVLSQVDGRRYVHQLIGDTQLDGSGAATLGVVPLLRFTPTDGDVMEWVRPMLEGFVTGAKTQWTLEMVRRIGIKFAVVEDR